MAKGIDLGPEYPALGRILSRKDLAKLPKPEPLIEGVLSLRSYALMVGEGGANKTFAALGFACSVATGVPWMGRAVRVGKAPVVYVVGEGAFGIDGRISAWEEENGVQARKLTTLMKPDSLMAEDFWPEMTAFARAKKARMVVFDTLSSLAPDCDEVKDAPLLTRRLSDLATSIDGTSLLLHHTGWGPKDRARGSSALEHNADETLILQKAEEHNSRVVSMWRKKVKEGADGERLWLERVDVGGSCVLQTTEEPEAPSKPPAKNKEKASLRNVLSVLRAAADLGEDIGYEELRLRCAGAQNEKASCIRVVLEKGYVDTKKKGRVNVHFLTEAGRDYLTSYHR